MINTNERDYLAPDNPARFAHTRWIPGRLGSVPIVCLFVALLATSCSVIPSPDPSPQCSPLNAAEILSVIVRNTSAQDLHDYPVAIAFDRANFDFGLAAKDGSNVAAWNPVTRHGLPYWLESYTPEIGRGLMWVRLPNLLRQSSVLIWLTG